MSRTYDEQERKRPKDEVQRRIAEIDPEWLRQMAEKEDNCILSVGGLVKRIDKEEREAAK